MQATSGASVIPIAPPIFHFQTAEVVALGDSIRRGAGAPSGQDWPSDARRLLPDLTISNRGIDGNPVIWPACLTCDLPAVQRLSRDVLSIPGTKTLVVLDGVN